jgi:putative transposase
MTETIEVVPDRIDQQQLAQQLVEAARADGVELVGPGGLLTGLTKTVLETALEAEMTEHLGYERHERAERDGRNSRNGTRTKTVLTEIGPVQIEVPRDRDASFEPVIVRKRQRRLDGIDEIVLSLTARGLTTGEIAAHFDEVYGAKVSAKASRGHHLPDHRQGPRGDGGVAEPAARRGLPGAVHRRHPRQGPR